MRIWVTRAEPGASATARRLRDLGHEPFVAPLLTVRHLEPVVDLTDVAALAFTSADGVAAFARLTPIRDLPVFAVGDATAQAAREAGFGTVHSAQGDVEALAALVARQAPAMILHAAAREPAGDLGAQLAGAGVPLRTLVVYETVEQTPPSALPPLDAVLVHSPRAARALAGCAAAFGLPALCISPAAGQALSGKFRTIATAPFPNEAALLKLLEQTRP